MKENQLAELSMDFAVKHDKRMKKMSRRDNPSPQPK